MREWGFVAILVVIYFIVVAYYGTRARDKYEYCRELCGHSKISVIKTKSAIDVEYWKSDIKLKEHMFVKQRTFREIGYTDVLENIFHGKMDVDGIVMLYCWEMPNFNWFNNTENRKNAIKFQAKAILQMVGDTIEIGHDSRGNAVARLLLESKTIAIWKDDTDSSYQLERWFQVSDSVDH